MKKKLMISAILGVGLVVLSIVFVSDQSALANDNSLKYDFGYLFKWVASQMKININPQKPVPLLVFMSGDDLQAFCEEITGKKLRYYLDEARTIKFDKYANAFYWPPHKTIYARNDLDSEESVEGLIVHEIVHSIQHLYFGIIKSNEWSENEAQAVERKFCREHGFPVLGLRVY